jgi:DHA1 family multidrug resistance protein-like MFS transporter
MTTTARSLPTPDAGRSDWRRVLAVFWVTSLVEGLGVAQIFAFLPSYLGTMGVPEPDRLRFVGLFGALIFVVGMPLVPLWGVWADKYSRKAVIVRSALVEAVVFAAVALSREPWQLALSMLLVGFQLGNTGVMLGAIRDSAPRARIGTAMAVFGAASPIGFAVGPVLGGVIGDRLGWGIPAIFTVSAVLSIGTALLIGLGSREVRPEVVPTGPALRLAFGAIRGVIRDVPTRRIFAIFFVAFLANQMTRAYVPVLVSRANGPVDELSAIGLVTGTAALLGALFAPVGGWLGDRIGYRWVLVGSLVGSGVAVLGMPFAPSVPALALVAVIVAALYATVAPMVFALLGTEVPAERRSQTLNLVYLPLYLGGIVGPLLAAFVVSFGIAAPFVVGAVVFVIGGLLVAVQARRQTVSDADAATRPIADGAAFEAEGTIESRIG